MKASWSSASSAQSHSFLTLTLLLAIGISTGCSTSSPSAETGLAGNTNVTVLLSSTANDQVTTFDVSLKTLTLTSRTGKTVTLLSSQQPAEFMHLNGGIEPLMTVSLPQDIYTSATATLGGAVYVCLGQVPGGGLGIANYSIVNQGPTVNLPAPLTVTGSSMALVLNMQVSNSAVFSDCWTTPPFSGFSMTPTFALAPVTLSASPTNSGNGKVSGLLATVASLGSAPSTFTLTVAGGQMGSRTLSASSNNATVFQGVSGASALSPGMFLNVDGATQPDGSLLATRIEVENSSALNDSSGPVVSVNGAGGIVQLYGRSELGALQTIGSRTGIYWPVPFFDTSAASFHISGQFTNLQNLPFVPSFGASTLVAGQNVDIASGNFVTSGGAYTPANTVTLVPQTIDGTVIASQPSGSFVDYSVSLASYDLFPTRAVQPGQTTTLTNPSQVEVYVDSSTQKLNTQAPTSGGTLRFYGLVFNDNGTLRMDCAQVSNGVSTMPQASFVAGSPSATETVRRNAGGLVVHTATTN